jgi:hypothetical protein
MKSSDCREVQRLHAQRELIWRLVRTRAREEGGRERLQRVLDALDRAIEDACRDRYRLD